MSEMPKISIGITTYNRPAFLREAIESILNQSFGNFEIIVSNDYLDVPVTWDSLGLVMDSRVRLVNQSFNLGELKNMNFLLEAARGDWFIWLADDDLMHPEFFSNALKVIEASSLKTLSAVYSNYLAAENPLGVFPEEIVQPKLKYLDALDFIERYSSRSLPLVGVYGLMRTDFLREIGGMINLGNSFSPYSDNLIPLMLAKFGDIAWFEARFVFLRTHSESLSCKSSDISAFTTAETDFMRHLNLMLSTMNFNVNCHQVRANMIAWFAHNEFAVILRDPKLTVTQKISNFLYHQYEHHLPRLALRYKFRHIKYVLSLVLRERVLALRLKFR